MNKPIPFDAQYIVVFNFTMRKDLAGYDAASSLLANKVKEIPGFICEYSFNNGPCATSITYWKDLDSIQEWKNDEDHLRIQVEARRRWYSDYSVFVCSVARKYEHSNENLS